MCGIVGFTGRNQAAPILLDGLSKLEYRGYDSAGIAVRDGEKDAEVVKAKGRLAILAEKTDDGKAVKVPTAYFKALLGYKKSGTISITGTTGGYTGIAFYYPHEAYSGSWKSKAMSIDDLEKLVGEDFFVNLPAKIGADRAATVEAYFSTSDKLWQ